jgi:hypothetical protein
LNAAPIGLFFSRQNFSSLPEQIGIDFDVLSTAEGVM